MLKIFKIIYILIKFNTLSLLLKENKITTFFLNNKRLSRAQIIKNTLEHLGPIYIKIGQILSTRIDIIPQDIINEIKILQTNVNFFKFKIIKKIIEHDLNNEIKIIFHKINENPIASASIAQIHTAILKNNKKVIIKILKPNVIKSINEDIQILKIIAKIIHIVFKKSRRLKLIDLINEAEKILNIESNLKNEATNLIKIKNNFLKNKKIYIPNIDWNMITKNILILEYIDGINITNIKKIIKLNINTEKISQNLIELFYIQTFKHKFFHADLHPGNILISKNTNNKPIIILLDFGITSFLTEKEKKYLSENILAFSQKNYKKVAKLHLKAGTINIDKNITHIEKELLLIFNPILNKKIKNISFKKTLIQLLSLSKNMNMQLQPNFVLFQKTLLSIESISRHINSSINLWKLTRQSLEKLIVKDMIKTNIKKYTKYFSIQKFKKKTKNNFIKSSYIKTKITIFVYIIFILILNNIIYYKNIILLLI